MSLSKSTGFHWKTIWNASGNADVKSARASGKVLLPGDRLVIPEKQEKHDSGSTEQKHRFRRIGLSARLKLRFRAEGKPLAKQPYIADIDGALQRGETDPDGVVDLVIPGNATRGSIRVGEGSKRRTYVLNLGSLSPHDSAAGIQSRLRNLGYAIKQTDGRWNESMPLVLRQFQQDHGLAPTGSADKSTCDKLKEVHGS